MKDTSNKQKWTDYYTQLDSLMYPNEYVLRTLVGNYPNLNLELRKGTVPGRANRILDMSCGDGRNMRLLYDLELDVCGTEISDEICQKVKKNLIRVGIPPNIINVRVGDNQNLPWDSSEFDYILSWNAIYYLNGINGNIATHVKEHARVLRKGGKLVCSVPGPRCYSLLGAEVVKEHVLHLRPTVHSGWGGGVLDSTIFYSFEGESHIQKVFGEYFEDFRFCHLFNDCFGLPLEYFIFVCDRK